MRRHYLFLTAFLAISLSGCSYDVVVIDSDGDGVSDEKDACPYDKLKTTDPGKCGCGYREAKSETGNLICQSLGLVDSDGDTVPDIYDECPQNPSLHAKDEKCGCDTDGKVDIATQARICQAYVDSDGDGVVDDLDGCPYDSSKTEPGECGCGQIDYRENVEQETLICRPNIDSDSDTVPDVYDACPFNPLKKVEGNCGCDKPEEPSCGTAFEDRCPGNKKKLEPGFCGCNMLDIDQCPRNGVPDCIDVLDSHLMANPPACLDLCPEDDEKTEPGFCGCGVKDIDTDSDGNVDYCLTGDEPCATVDSDGDGVLDCWDQCPFDDKKIEPGFCGCGVKDIDKDDDGNVDYCLTGNEQCPTVDSDGDGVLDCWDPCPFNNAIFDDADCDGTPDTEDACPYNPEITSEDKQYDNDYPCQYNEDTQTFTVGTGEDLSHLREFLEDWWRTFEISADEDEGPQAPMPRKPISLDDLAKDRLTIRLIDNIQIHISEAQVLEYDEWGENPTLRPSWLPLPPVFNADIVGGFIKDGKAKKGTPIRITVTDGQKRVPLAGPLFRSLDYTNVSNLILDYDVKGTCPAGLATDIFSSDLTNLTFSGSLEFSQDMQENDEYCYAAGGIAGYLSSHSPMLSDFPSDIGEVEEKVTLNHIKNVIDSFKCLGICGGMIGAIEGSGSITATNVSNVIHKMTCDAFPTDALDSDPVCGGAFGSIALYIESDDSGVVKINHLENRIDDLKASGMSGGFVGTFAYMGDAVDTPIAVFEHIFSEVSAFKNDDLLGDDKSSSGLLFGTLSAYADGMEMASAFKLSNIFTIGQTPYLLGNNLKESSVLDVNHVYYYGVDQVFGSNPGLPVKDGGDIPAFIKFEPGKIAEVVEKLNRLETSEIWTSNKIEFNGKEMSIPVFKDSAIFDAAQE